MQNKTVILLLLGALAYTNAIETASLKSKIKNLAQLSAQVQGNSHNVTAGAAEDCELEPLEEPELGDLSGDLLDWCPEEFGSGEGELGSNILTSSLATL